MESDETDKKACIETERKLSSTSSSVLIKHVGYVLYFEQQHVKHSAVIIFSNRKNKIS